MPNLKVKKCAMAQTIDSGRRASTKQQMQTSYTGDNVLKASE